MTTQNAPASFYRSTEGLGVWPHKGKVAAVGIGHSPTARRWDGTPENTMGANRCPTPTPGSGNVPSMWVGR